MSLNQKTLDQGGDDWLKWRRGGIGSSDAPVIMGVSPYQTPRQLWELKTGRRKEQETNFAMERGNDLEPKARAAYELIYKRETPPIVFEHSEVPWLRASLDGYNKPESIVLEIKCPGEKDHSLAKKGEVPEKYKPQLQHQLMITGARVVHYWSFDGSKGALVEVFPDVAYHQKLFRAESDFWEYVIKDEPPPLTDQDVISLDSDPAFKNKCIELREVKRMLDNVKRDFEELKKEIEGMMPHARVSCAGVKITRTVSKGNVDYSKVPEIEGIDLDKYRKPENVSYRFTFPK